MIADPDDPEEHPILASVLEQNIKSVSAQRDRIAGRRSAQDRISDAITDFSGHMAFAYLHVLWFAGWIAWNLGAFGAKPFDPFPFGLLTLIVSLEAIFLSTFVLISQNRISEDAERRASLHLQIGLLTEHEMTRALKMLDQIQTKLGCDEEPDSDLKELEQEVRPEDVLREIEKMQRKVRGH
ncbi:MAG: DUF1003 domain-containing protein [Acidobacteriota bacterium]